MSRSLLVVLALALTAAAHPLRAQTDPPPPPPDEDGEGTATLPPTLCPKDFLDGPLYADGREYYGITARRTVESFLSAPYDTSERLETATQHLRPTDLRILTDYPDADVCRSLSLFLSNGRTWANDRHSIYFKAGDRYFVAQWQAAQALSNYTLTYARVLVFDSSINLIGFYAF